MIVSDFGRLVKYVVPDVKASLEDGGKHPLPEEWAPGFSMELWSRLHRGVRSVFMNPEDSSEDDWQTCSRHHREAEPFWEFSYARAGKAAGRCSHSTGHSYP